MTTQKSIYSQLYLSIYHTIKTLVDVFPNGVVTFCSSLFPGSTSNKKITLYTSLLDQLESEDFILADKGFFIRDILPTGYSSISR